MLRNVSIFQLMVAGFCAQSVLYSLLTGSYVWAVINAFLVYLNFSSGLNGINKN